MTHPPYLRAKARELRRKKKLTLDEIATRLALGKTTVWYWIKDIDVHVADTPRRAASRRRAVTAVTLKHARVREASYRRGWDEFPALIGLPGFRDFICMYIGEGHKRNRNRVSLGNSDPRVVRLANHWIRRLGTNEVTYALQFHADQDPQYLVRFWASFLRADEAEIRLQRKSNSGRLAGRSWRSRWGVLSVCTNDTQLRARLQAWIDRVQDGWLDSAHGV